MNLRDMDNPETWPELQELIRRIKISYRRLTRDYRPESAEDIVQEVLTRWMEKPRQKGQAIKYAVIDVLRARTKNARQSQSSYQQKLSVYGASPFSAFLGQVNTGIDNFEDAFLDRDEVQSKFKRLSSYLMTKKPKRGRKNPKYYRPQVLSAISQMMLEGYTQKEIATSFGVTECRLNQVLTKYQTEYKQLTKETPENGFSRASIKKRSRGNEGSSERLSKQGDSREPFRN